MQPNLKWSMCIVCYLVVVGMFAELLAAPVEAKQVRGEQRAKQVADARCPETLPTGSGNYAGPITFAQTFTALNTGKLTRAKIQIAKSGSGGDLRVSINKVDQATGMPTGTVLAAKTIAVHNPDNQLASEVVKADFKTDRAAKVVSGRQYALVVRSLSQDIQVSLVGGPSNVCTGQAFLSSAGQRGPFATLPWGDGSYTDVAFAAFVTPTDKR